MQRTARLWAAVLGLVCAVSCAVDGRPCAPDDYAYCDCPSGARGYAQCAADGSGYGGCDCSGNIPEGAGVLIDLGAEPPDAGASDSGLAGFLEVCSEDGECETGLCFPYNAFGPHCTTPCDKDSECPPPSPGCSGMGVCKLQ